MTDATLTAKPALSPQQIRRIAWIAGPVCSQSC